MTVMHADNDDEVGDFKNTEIPNFGTKATVSVVDDRNCKHHHSSCNPLAGSCVVGCQQ
jgi:hypothetical protein